MQRSDVDRKLFDNMELFNTAFSKVVNKLEDDEDLGRSKKLLSDSKLETQGWL